MSNIILYAPPMFTSASLPLIKFTATTKAGDDSTASLSAPDSWVGATLW